MAIETTPSWNKAFNISAANRQFGRSDKARARSTKVVGFYALEAGRKPGLKLMSCQDCTKCYGNCCFRCEKDRLWGFLGCRGSVTVETPSQQAPVGFFSSPSPFFTLKAGPWAWAPARTLPALAFVASLRQLLA